MERVDAGADARVDASTPTPERRTEPGVKVCDGEDDGDRQRTGSGGASCRRAMAPEAPSCIGGRMR